MNVKRGRHNFKSAILGDGFGSQMMGGVSKSKNLNADVLDGVVQGEAVST